MFMNRPDKARNDSSVMLVFDRSSSVSEARADWKYGISDPILSFI